MNKHFYVYIYLDPRKPGIYNYQNLTLKHEPFYVGKGHGDRDRSHLYNKKNLNRPLPNKINKILKETENEPIIIRYKKHLFEDESYNLEIELISIIGRKNLNCGPLLNLTDGGEGGRGTVVSNKTKKLLSELRIGKNNPNYGKKASIEKRKHISDGVQRAIKEGKDIGGKDKTHTEEAKKKMSIAKKGKFNGNDNPFYGKTHTQESKQKISEANKGKTAWNKGQPNPNSAENGRKSAEKQRQTVTGRKRQYRDDGSWFWFYPNKS